MSIKQLYTKFLIALCSICACSIHGQSLSSVLDSVEKKYNVTFAYDASLLNSFEWKYPQPNSSLISILDEIARGNKLEYNQISDQKILIRQSAKPLSNKLIDYNLAAKIVDIDSGEPLAYAAIYSDDLQVGTTTDVQGNFSLVVGDKDQNINIQYLGYQPKRIPAEQVNGKDIIYLMTKMESINTIEISDSKPKMSIYQGTSNQIYHSYLDQSSSIINGDPLAKLKSLPGFQANDELSVNSGFRGSSADANKYLLDGMPLLQVDHFFGIFSSIQESIVQKIDLYKNTWPVEIGGRTSALIDIQTGVVDSTNNSFSINNLTGQLSINASLGDFGQLLFAGRTTLSNISNTDLFDFLYKNERQESLNTSRRILQSVEPNFGFYDYYLKGDFKLTERTSFSLKHFASQDDFSYDYNQTYLRNVNEMKLPTAEDYGELSIWKNESSGFNLSQRWNSKLKSDFNINYAVFDLEEDINIGLSNPTRPIQGFKISISNNFDNAINLLQTQWNNELKIKKYLLKFGYQYEQVRSTINLDIDGENVLNLDQETNHHIGFLGIENNFNNQTNWSISSRFTSDKLSNKLLFSPRISIKHFLAPQTLIKFASTINQQTLRQSYYEDRFGRGRSFWVLSDGDRLPILNSWNTMLGFTHSIKNFRIDLEAYYNQINGVTQYALVFPTIPSGQVNNGDKTPAQLQLFAGNGINYGMDWILTYTYKKLETQLAYSLSKSSQIIEELNGGNAYPSQDDRRHQLKWLNNLNFGKWNFYLNAYFSSGKPYLDLTTGEFLTTNRRNISFDQYIKNLDSYKRLDVGADYAVIIGNKVKINLGASVFNVTNVQNEAYRQNVYAVDQTNASAIYGNSVQLLNATPTIYLKASF